MRASSLSSMRAVRQCLSKKEKTSRDTCHVSTFGRDVVGSIGFPCVNCGLAKGPMVAHVYIDTIVINM